MKGIIIYKGKYGATRQYAAWLADALQLPVATVGDGAVSQLPDADFVILGTSIYIGKLQLKSWIRENMDILSNKKVYVFIVTGTSLDEKEKLEGYIRNNIPDELRKRCNYFFFPGKLEFRKLSWKDRLLLRIGAWLSKGSRNEIPLVDYNRVDQRHISGLVRIVSEWRSGKQSINEVQING